MAKVTDLNETQEFKKDKCKTAAAKNRRLSTLLLTAWLKLDIVKIKRIEIGTDSGWLITYRE